MRQPTIIRAQMHDGEIVTEEATDFGAFLRVVLPLRRDPACIAVRWYRCDDEEGWERVREDEWRTEDALAGRRRAEAYAGAC